MYQSIGSNIREVWDQIPNTQEEKVSWIRRNLLPLINQDLAEIDANSVGDETLEEAGKILAKAYLEEGPGTLLSMLKVIVPIFIVDLLTFIPANVYGLVLSTMGTFILLVHADILGPDSIAAVAQNSGNTASKDANELDILEAERQARNTVIANIGLVWMVCGFGLQIVASFYASNSEFLNVNYLKFLGI